MTFSVVIIAAVVLINNSGFGHSVQQDTIQSLLFLKRLDVEVTSIVRNQRSSMQAYVGLLVIIWDTSAFELCEVCRRTKLPRQLSSCVPLLTLGQSSVYSLGRTILSACSGNPYDRTATKLHLNNST